MIQVTIFSGHEGRLRFDKYFYLTLFAGCEMIRPTVARQLLASRKSKGDGLSPARTPFFLTVFGGASIKSPTLVEEFIELREMLAAGLLSMDDWDRAMGDISGADGNVASFTLFGGFDECELPSLDEEVDSLAVQRHLGAISESAGQTLQYAIGQKGSERRSAVRRAILQTA